MEPTHTSEHMHEHVVHHKNILTKDFYLFVGIITFTLIVLQPLAMLAAMFWQAINQ